MTKIRNAVVVALLAVWCFPAVSLAKPEPATPPALPSLVTSRSAAPATEGSAGSSQAAEATSLAQREAQSRDLQDYRGGEGVTIFVGSGVLLVVVIVLLILLI